VPDPAHADAKFFTRPGNETTNELFAQLVSILCGIGLDLADLLCRGPKDGQQQLPFALGKPKLNQPVCQRLYFASAEL